MLLMILAGVISSAPIATISHYDKKCEIVRSLSGGEDGDTISVQCEQKVVDIDHDLKGVSVDKISSCEAIINIKAVNFPKLYEVNICKRALIVKNIGDEWRKNIISFYGINNDDVEYLIFEKNVRDSCYNVRIIYDRDRSKASTAYETRQRKFCAR